METLAAAAAPEGGTRGRLPELLVADDDAWVRTQLAAAARRAAEDLSVLEAEDGAEAVQLGLQRRPGVALLGVRMPRLGGVEAAVTLRELRPQMRLALHAVDPHAHAHRARELRLPLFDTLAPERAVRWLELQVRTPAGAAEPARPARKLLACAVCGYGAARATPPARCPMCQGEGAWIHTARRPFGRTGRPRRR